MFINFVLFQIYDHYLHARSHINSSFLNFCNYLFLFFLFSISPLILITFHSSDTILISHITSHLFFYSLCTHSQVEFIYSILSNLTQQCPNGRLLDICLSHFLKIVQGKENEGHKNEKLSLESIKGKKIEKKEDNNNDSYANDCSSENVENDKNDDNISKEHKQRKIAALDAISNLFLSEIEDGNNEKTTSTSTSNTHVHTSSCNHDHHNDTSVKR